MCMYEPMANLPRKETTKMIWSCVKEGRGGYQQKDVKNARAGKEKKGGGARRDGWTILGMT